MHNVVDSARIADRNDHPNTSTFDILLDRCPTQWFGKYIIMMHFFFFKFGVRTRTRTIALRKKKNSVGGVY